MGRPFPPTMMFGDALEPADPEAAAWIDHACQGEWWTVGALVPNHFESLLRVHAPAPCDDWWTAYRGLFDTVAEVGQRHTSTPDRAWYAVWEGHGFDNSSAFVAWAEPPADETERRAREVERQWICDEQDRQNADIRSALTRVSRFDRPGRSYYLLSGPIAAVTDMHYPDHDVWRNPDLLWPDDREWFVATDADFWSLYIGGSTRFTNELAASVPTQAVSVELDLSLEVEN